MTGEQSDILSVFHLGDKPALRCFISHSYEDKDAVSALLALLPSRVEPIVFPPIPPSPSAAVTTDLIKSISAADLLIYVKAGRSGASHWVNFERRYALRRGIPTFAFHPSSGTLTRETEAASNIMITPLIKYPYPDGGLIHSILDWLQVERNVHLIPVRLDRPEDQAFDADMWSRQRRMMEQVDFEFSFKAGQGSAVNIQMWEFVRGVHWGGALVLFLSNAACEVPWPSVDLYLGYYRWNALMGLEKPKLVWIEPPDQRRIEAAFEALGPRPDNEKFQGLVGKTLFDLLFTGGTDHEQNTNADRRPLVVGDGKTFNWILLDTLLIDLEATAGMRETKPPGTRLPYHLEQETKERERAALRRRQRLAEGKVPWDDTDF